MNRPDVHLRRKPRKVSLGSLFDSSSLLAAAAQGQRRAAAAPVAPLEGGGARDSPVLVAGGREQIAPVAALGATMLGFRADAVSADLLLHADIRGVVLFAARRVGGYATCRRQSRGRVWLQHAPRGAGELRAEEPVAARIPRRHAVVPVAVATGHGGRAILERIAVPAGDVRLRARIRVPHAEARLGARAPRQQRQRRRRRPQQHTTATTTPTTPTTTSSSSTAAQCTRDSAQRRLSAPGRPQRQGDTDDRIYRKLPYSRSFWN